MQITFLRKIYSTMQDLEKEKTADFLKGLNWECLPPKEKLIKLTALKYYHDNFTLYLVSACCQEELDDAVEGLYACMTCRRMGTDKN